MAYLVILWEERRSLKLELFWTVLIRPLGNHQFNHWINHQLNPSFILSLTLTFHYFWLHCDKFIFMYTVSLLLKYHYPFPSEKKTPFFVCYHQIEAGGGIISSILFKRGKTPHFKVEFKKLKKKMSQTDNSQISKWSWFYSDDCLKWGTLCIPSNNSARPRGSTDSSIRGVREQAHRT